MAALFLTLFLLCGCRSLKVEQPVANFYIYIDAREAEVLVDAQDDIAVPVSDVQITGAKGL